MRTRLVLTATLAGLALVAGACGSSDGDTPSPNANVAPADARTIEIEMRDTAFVPETITVPAGEEVRLVFRNSGRVDHDAFIGDRTAQADHERDMTAAGAMHHGGGGEAITVGPGDTATLTHTFAAGDDVLIGCHQPGHYTAGMKVTVSTS